VRPGAARISVVLRLAPNVVEGLAFIRDEILRREVEAQQTVVRDRDSRDGV
jgi:hypothetical protein